MRIRIKFTKTGNMKYIGHLDVMRYFQKVLRRAEIDVAFSGGFSPHMLMSFAAPLGVGTTSLGEYFDLDVNSVSSANSFLECLNNQMSEGFSVVSVCQIPEDKASKGMSQVACADYHIVIHNCIDENCLNENPIKNKIDDSISDFLSQKEILVFRKTKRTEGETDIKPWIYEFKTDENGYFLKVSQGSVHNLKPELVMQAYFSYLGQEMKRSQMEIQRLEIYADTGDETNHCFVPLCEMGQKF